MIQLIIFDMDGLMFDTERLCMDIFIELGQEYGLNIETKHYTDIIAVPYEEMVQYLMESFGERELIEELLIKCNNRLLAHAKNNGIPIKKGLLELLQFLDANHYKKAIASSSSLETIHLYLKSTGLEDRFDYIISGTECKAGKPNPEIFIRTCEHFNLPVEQALVLEDSVNGIMAAKDANIKCIAIPDLISYDSSWNQHFYDKKADLTEVIEVLNNFSK